MAESSIARPPPKKKVRQVLETEVPRKGNNYYRQKLFQKLKTTVSYLYPIERQWEQST